MNHKTQLITYITLAPIILLGLFYFGAIADQEQNPGLPQQNSSIIDKKIFGYSKEGRVIEGVVIGQGNEKLLLIAATHGNEMSGTALLNRFIEEVEKNPDSVSLDKSVILIPIVNPDGYYDREDKLNANNVNLNRNFATSNWIESGFANTYSGPHPFSEAESITLKNVVDTYEPSMMISYHAKGAFVTPERNDKSGRKLARWYASQTGYKFDGNDDIWDFEGTATKWFWEATGNPGITVELTTYSDSDWDINKSALFKLISSD